MEAPLLLYVGRIGAEKKLERLKKVLEANPGCRLAIVGKGPTDQHIREYFKGYPVHFAGQLTGNHHPIIHSGFSFILVFTPFFRLPCPQEKR